MAVDTGSVPFSNERKRRDAQEEAFRIQESVQLLDMAAREGEPQAMVLLGNDERCRFSGKARSGSCDWLVRQGGGQTVREGMVATGVCVCGDG